MDKRKTERVQFFQLSTERSIQPVWVFRQTHAEAVLGLLFDIGASGAQVLTTKSDELFDEKPYQLIVHADDDPVREALKVNVRRCWSRGEGTMYVRNGLIFEETVSLPHLFAIHEVEPRWLRCELLPL